MVCGHKMGAMTFGIMTLSIMTFSITIIKCHTQHNEKIQLSDRQSIVMLNVANNLFFAECLYTECHSTDCRYAESQGAHKMSTQRAKFYDFKDCLNAAFSQQTYKTFCGRKICNKLTRLYNYAAV